MSQLFQIAKLKLTQYISSISLLYKNVGFYLEGVSDCEELVGVTWRLSDCED